MIRPSSGYAAADGLSHRIVQSEAAKPNSIMVFGAKTGGQAGPLRYGAADRLGTSFGHPPKGSANGHNFLGLLKVKGGQPCVDPGVSNRIRHRRNFPRRSPVSADPFGCWSARRCSL